MRLFRKLGLLGLGILFDRFSTAETDYAVFTSWGGGEPFGGANIHFSSVPGSTTKYPVFGFFSARRIE